LSKIQKKPGSVFAFYCKAEYFPHNSKIM